MSAQRPGVLAVRAVNQYRRRDILPYLGLRYYLNASAARTDDWARRVCPDLVLTRNEPSYLEVQHFKDVNPHGGIGHRRLFLPGPNEAIAEAALLDECASHPEFDNPSCVYSYPLSKGGERDGVFRPYFEGLRKRHDGIAAACNRHPNGIVRYVDIRRFYPSMTHDIARAAWLQQAHGARLQERWIALGERLMDDHHAVGAEGERGVLTGPMFSHLLGNLVLRSIDDVASNLLPGRYFRYVDDLVFVGTTREVEDATSEIRTQLQDIGLELHDDSSAKSLSVPTTEWLQGRNDFRDRPGEVSWMTFVGDLKRFLLLQPNARTELAAAFRDNGMRIPVGDWSEAAREANRVERVLRWAKHQRFRKKAQHLSVERLVEHAVILREMYLLSFREMLETSANVRGFDRKRRVPKLRYRAGRLVYLAKESDLADLARGAMAIPELQFHGTVMNAVASRDIGSVLRFGTNAAQAAAHALRAAGKPVLMPSFELGDTEKQALAVVLLNGVQVQYPGGDLDAASDLLEFARSGSSLRLMKSAPPFIRELACLHGMGSVRHPDVLESVFDEDEIMAMDAVDQLQQSDSE